MQGYINKLNYFLMSWSEK